MKKEWKQTTTSKGQIVEVYTKEGANSTLHVDRSDRTWSLWNGRKKVRGGKLPYLNLIL